MYSCISCRSIGINFHKLVYTKIKIAKLKDISFLSQYLRANNHIHAYAHVHARTHTRTYTYMHTYTHLKASLWINIYIYSNQILFISHSFQNSFEAFWENILTTISRSEQLTQIRSTIADSRYSLSRVNNRASEMRVLIILLINNIHTSCLSILSFTILHQPPT